MAVHNYRILNVFTAEGARLSGNPLCAFEDGRGLDDATMAALALQFNLSETIFISPSQRATAQVRIFTAAVELPFAGHPTLGAAHVVRAMTGEQGVVTLEMRAGIIPVSARGDTWTLQAPPPRWRRPEATPAQLAAMLGVATEDIGETPLWVDTGNEQLIIPVTSVAAVRRCAPEPVLFAQAARLRIGRSVAYVWAEVADGQVEARFFSATSTLVREDAATGAACANLGGWFIATQTPLPLTRLVRQGDAVRRPSRLGLQIDAARRIFVSGEVVELGRGVITL
jgi:trans-2,3-dihydro-3-hydroxyanthranilate isomerase